MSHIKEWLRKCFSLLSDVAMIIGRVTTIGSIPVGATVATFCEDSRAYVGDASTFLFQESGAFVAGSIFGGVVVASSSTSTAWVNNGVVYFRNQIPYSATEKKAEHIYSILHCSGWKVLNKNALIAESGLAVNTAFQAFGNAPCDSIIENLDLFEELLEVVASKTFGN